MSQLSDSTIAKLADTLVSDVIDYINEDERLTDFYLEVIGDALCEKLGNKKEDGTCDFGGDLSSELIMEIADRIILTTVPTGESKDILSYFRNRNV